MKMKKIATVLLGGMFLASSSIAFADEKSNDVNEQTTIVQHHKMEKTQHPKMKRDSFHQRIDDVLFKGVNLTEDQSNEIDKLRKEVRDSKREDRRSMMKSMYSMHQELKAIALSNDYSDEKVQSVLNKYSDQMQSSLKEQTKLENKIFNVLDADQQKVYKDNISNVEKEMINNSHWKKENNKHQRHDKFCTDEKAGCTIIR